MWHGTGTSAWVMPAGLTVQPLAHIESAEGKRRIKNLVEVSGLVDQLLLLKPRAATEEEILRLHTPEYVARIKRESDALGGDAGELTPFGHGSYEIALLSAGGCITAVDAVLDGKVDNAYALVRPHGHHAERDSGKGFNINVPLPAGSGVGAYVATFEKVVAPALRNFGPELIVIASGLDASAMDPLASMMMTSEGYRQLTQIMLATARDVCGGRLIACHEGGYSPAYVPYCGLAIMEELAGVDTGLEDPLLPLLAAMGGQALQPHQATVIDEAAKLAQALKAKAAAR